MKTKIYDFFFQVFTGQILVGREGDWGIKTLLSDGAYTYVAHSSRKKWDLQ